MEGMEENQDVSGNINVVSPSGELGSIPPDQFKQYANLKYRKATDQDLHEYVQQQTYGTTGQQIIGAGEAAARAGTFGLSTAVEKGLGVSNEGILGREEQLPSEIKIPAELGGLGLSMLTGVGEGELLGAAGKATAEALGLGAAKTTLAKIGSSAAKTAVETALYQGGDEVHKMFTDQYANPSDAVEGALMNMGMAGALGGVLGAGAGAMSPLWNATAGPKLESALSKVKDYLNNGSVISPTIDSALNKTGIEASPAVKALLSDTPFLQDSALNLAQSTSASGTKVKASVGEFRKSVAKTALEAVGKTEEDIPRLQNLSKSDAGSNIKKTYVDDFKQLYKGSAEKYEKIAEELHPNVLAPQDKTILADQLGNLSVTENYIGTSGSPELKVINRIIESLPGQRTFGQLQKMRDNFLSEVYNSHDFRLYGQLRKIFDGNESALIDQFTAGQSKEAIETLAAARAGYKDLMTKAEALDDTLKVGRYKNAKGFLTALEETQDEKFIDRLSGKNNAAWLRYVSENNPEVASQIKEYHLSKLVRDAAGAAKNGEVIDSAKLIKSLKQITKDSPELRDFLLAPESLSKLDASEELLSKINSLKWNWSNTAPTEEALKKYGVGSVTAAISMAMGHGFASSAVLGILAKALGKDVPDAIRLGLIKFLASGQPIEAGGFKAMVDFIEHTMKGEKALNRGVKALFQSGLDVLPSHMIPDAKSREKLDKKLKKLQDNPEGLLDIGGKMPHYLDQHGATFAQTMASNVNDLNSLRPSEEKMSPLDSKPVISKAKQMEYERALDIADQPMILLEDIKNGTLNPQDVLLLQKLRPGAYSKMSQKLNHAMIDHLAKGEDIPYRTRMGLSTFLGQPLDSTMTQQGIALSQASFQQQIGQSAQGQQQRAKHSMTALNKMAGSYKTPGQSREAYRAK